MSMKIAFLGAAAALTLTAGAGTAQADHREDQRRCFNRITRAEHNFQQSIRRHGFNSRRAAVRRAELRHAQAQCRGFSGLRGGRFNRGRDDNRWRGRDHDRDHRWNRGRRDNTWNRGRHLGQRKHDSRWRDDDHRGNRGRRDNAWNRGRRDRDRDSGWRDSRRRGN